MRQMRLMMGVMCVSCAAFFSAAAAGPSTAPDIAAGSAPAATDGALKVYITEVTGLVQVRFGDGQAWHAAAPQMMLVQGAELRTGPHSTVTCVIPPDQTFTLDRLGTVRVEEAARHGNKITTDLIMKYGRTHYDIEAAGLEHEGAIVSPSSTLAIRGTRVSLFDQPPFKPEAISYTGRAEFHYGRSLVYVGRKNGSFAKTEAGSDGAAQTALADTVVDPRYSAARTAADASLIASEVARGAVLSYDPVANIPVVTGGRPLFDSELPGHLPGALDFVLRWTGDANLNIEVGVDKGDPLTNITNGFKLGEFLYPGFGFQNSPSGGHIAFDHRGGPTGGEEIAYWTGAFPTGLYGIAAQSESGVATSFTFNVFANGKPLEMFYFGSDGSLIKSTQVTHMLAPGQNDTAIVPVPGVALLEQLVPDDPAGNPNPGITPSSFPKAKPAKVTAIAKPLSSRTMSPVAMKH